MFSFDRYEPLTVVLLSLIGLGSFLGHICLNLAYQNEKPGRVIAFKYSEMVYAFIYDWVLHVGLAVTDYVGAILIASSLFAILMRLHLAKIL